MRSRRAPTKVLHFASALLLGLAPFAAAQQRGILADDAGLVELREDKSANAKAVTTVKPGEPFSFVGHEHNDEWKKVRLASGETGWIPLDAVRLYFDRKDLPTRDPAGESEIDEAARGLGFNYVKVTRKAADGDAKSLTQFFELARAADGAAGESLDRVPTAVYHLLGDAKFAKYLAAQSLAERVKVRNIIVVESALPTTPRYLSRYFPETTKLLFRREIVDWPSPDGRLAIRKVFSDEFDLRTGKVVRAELINRPSGEVLCDLTADDIGKGVDREGSVLWAPDSQSFAYLSMDLTNSAGNLFGTPRPVLQRKVTTLYRVTAEKWQRVDVALDKVPGRDTDTELQGAIARHEYTEPIRWKAPNSLLLERHEYYEKMKPLVIGNETFNSMSQLSRWYDVTITIAGDGAPKLTWKTHKEQ